MSDKYENPFSDGDQSPEMSDEYENPFSDGDQSPGVLGAQIPGVHNMLDEFFAEEDMIDNVISQAAVTMKATVEDLAEQASNHRLRPRNYINRLREEYH